MSIGNAPDVIPYKHNGYEQIVVSTSVKTLTIPANTEAAQLNIGTEGDIRVRIDGTDPTASVGYPLKAGREYLIDTIKELQSLEMIRKDSANVTVDIFYLDSKP